MKVALVYDRVNKFGGAERLLLALHSLYPDAPIYTLVYDDKTAFWSRGIKIIPTFLNTIPFLRKRHEWLAPIAPLAFETLDFSGFDIVISVTSSDAKSIITKPNQLHVCYCLTPTRYFWSGEKKYSGDKKLRYMPKFIKQYLKNIDLYTSQRPDEYISISKEVQKRVKKYYNRESSVVYPAIEEKFYTKEIIDSKKRDYYLIVSRLVPYKKVDLAISVFNKLKLPLVIVGTGSEENKLRNSANRNIRFVGMVNDKDLIGYYRHAKAVIFPQEEDFGLVPLESQACGTPVIAFNSGGARETVIHLRTGYLFDHQTRTSLISAITKFEKTKIDYEDCLANSKKFSFSKFADEYSSRIEKIWKNFKSRHHQN